ncbi:sulfite reductase subunit beta [Abortiporus biennis]|nr:sulfite reductase subunit beta [Abortiporus biennis]
MTPSISAVARIAYLASDVVIDSQPSSSSTSAFQPSFQRLSETFQHEAHKPTILSVPFGADPGTSLVNRRSSGLLSYTTTANSRTLNGIFPHLTELSSLPVVLHIAVPDDLSDVLHLRSAIPFFIYSQNPQQAHDNALLASRIAQTEKKAVVHVFNVGKAADSIEEVEAAQVLPYIHAEKAHLNGVNGTNGYPSKSAAQFAKLYRSYEDAAAETTSIVGRPVKALTTSGSSEPQVVIFVVGSTHFDFELDGVSFVYLSLLSPLLPSNILSAIGSSVGRVLVAEQVRYSLTKWPPVFLEVLSAVQHSERESHPIVQSVVLGDAESISATDILKLIQIATNPSPDTRLQLGVEGSKNITSSTIPHVPKHEQSYVKLLNQVFGDRLEISNDPSLVPAEGELAVTPEFALGRIRGALDARSELVAAVQDLLQDLTISKELHTLLSDWLSEKDDYAKSKSLGSQIVKSIEASQVASPNADRVVSLQAHFPALSRWIVGSDAWSYDLGASGLHHAIASRLNINILVLDTTPYSSRNKADPSRRKQDVGLYAMNHGDVYVASVALYSSYSQVLQALAEADKFDGPSVILAYLPYTSENSPALEVLKETKLAVDTGFWPLYRWNPQKEREGKDPFALDSDSVKNDLQKFLDRQNHLSQLVRSHPQLATELVHNLGDTLKEARKQRALNAYQELLTSIDAPPLRVLFASDGGKAEKVARRLSTRAKLRGLSSTVSAMDSVSLEELQKEEVVAFVTSVAGQGEFPQNGRQLFKQLNAAVSRKEQPLKNLQYTVFSMGDSHYWPRPEDAHYYNKSGKDLDSRLVQLGGQRVIELGLGDDQDADGPETGYKLWEPQVWKLLGVDSVELKEAEPEPITNEHIKVASQYLRGTIAEGLADNSTGALAPSDTQLTKFHGIYQQDDRDIRDERQAQGVEPAYSFMIRVRLPGGVCSPEQWLLMDQIADEHGCGTFKITTRATFQFHGVIKRHLKAAIFDINRALLDTLAACGDVNRNVIVSAIPSLSNLHAQAYDFAKRVSAHLLPRTTAYHEIWLDKKLVAGEALQDVEPLYGEFYLPRKFKVAIAVPPTNDVDLFANDVGFIAIVDKDGNLAGFNVTAGGGMGVTHGNKKTYPRLGDVLGFCTVEQGVDVAEKIMVVQRDNGNRADRKNARLKYTIDRMGLENFKAEVERRLGYKLEPARPFTFDRNVDDYGWHQGQDGKHHFTAFIENGRIQDESGREFKTALREIAKVLKGSFRLTANQHLLISDVPTEDLPLIKSLMAKYKLDNLAHSALRLSSSACVAFPTCGLAMAESERYLPLLIDKVEKICEKNGLRNDAIIMRMTGCPNGCARPYVAEIAFVGKAPGTYLMLLGGGYHGQRLNKIYRESVTEPEILAILEPMIKHYALERREGEHFGDFVIRTGYISATESGKTWWDNAGGEGEHREVSVAA